MSGLDENQVTNDHRILGYGVNGKPSVATPILQFNFITKKFDWVSMSTSSNDFSELTGTIGINQIDDLLITAAKLADNSVTNSKIASLSVLASKLNSNAVETAKINNSAVTNDKIADVDPSKINQDGATDGQGLVWSDANSQYEPQTISGSGSMGDIGFLSKKEFESKLRSAEGFLSAIGDLATLTANTGKDMYIARAKVVFYVNTIVNSQSVGDKVELSINGAVIETARSGLKLVTTSATGAGALAFEYEFKNIGHKVLAGQIIKLEVTVLDSSMDVEGFIECFEEDTGTSPE